MNKLPWYYLFSYWGIILWLLSPWLPFPVLLILIMNLICFIIFLLFSNISFKVGLFILIIHLIPVIYLQKQKLDYKPLIIFYIIYTLFLLINNKTPLEVYGDMFKNPPKTISEYIQKRL
jgi:hypothetical protein